MLIGLRLSADKLHNINVIYPSRQTPYYRNPSEGIVEPDDIVGDYTLDDMRDIEYEIFGEEII